MRVLLIRHTKVDVPKGTCYGWTDVPLADSFPQEAALVKAELENRGECFDMIYSSPLTRARRLAEYCGYSNPQTDLRLREMYMGDWEMQRYDEINDVNLQQWYNDYIHRPTTNGESFMDLYNRVGDFLDELRQKSFRRVAVFTHGGVIICAGLYAGLYPQEECFNHMMPHGGILEIDI